MSWTRQVIAALVALTATLLGFSGMLVDERVAATLVAFGLLVALGLGGRPARRLRGNP
jgi:hypothetical protein